MKILCVDISPLAGELKTQGHEVLNILPWRLGAAEGSRPTAQQPFFKVCEFLNAHNFQPDFIIHGESLAERVLLSGLEELECPKIFWAIDSHLNMHWQQYYARLFDVLLTPHPSLWQALPKALQHPQVLQMARQGQNIAWKPHKERAHALAFVGVMNDHRPLRKWLCELIHEHDPKLMQVAQNISFAQMLELYSNSCMVPNEAIAFETNYRLLEGASCGAVVLSPDIGPDQNALFEPGLEFLIYHNGAELLEQIDSLQKDPQMAENIGRAAWERVQKEHLPKHRAEFIVNVANKLLKGESLESESSPLTEDFLKKDAATKTTRHEAQRAFWLSRVQCKRAKTLGQQAAQLPPAPPLSLPQHEELLAFTLRLWFENGLLGDAHNLMLAILRQNNYPQCLELNVCASFGALRLKDFDLAKQFLYREQKQLPQSFQLVPQNEPELCLLWAKILNRAARPWQAGFIFNHQIHLPAAALEVIILAEIQFEDYFTQNQEAQKALLELAHHTLASSKALSYFHLGYLARLSLHKSDDWRVQVDYALQNFLCCRLKEGLFELKEALQKAQLAGQEKAFWRILRACDGEGGAIARCLSKRCLLA